MARRAPRSLVPGVQGLEDRALQTVISPLAFGRHPQGHPADIASGSTNYGNPSPSRYLDPTSLTPRGLALARFSAVLSSSPFAVRSPIFVGNLADYTFVGKISSNQFLHGTLSMHFETPSSANGNTTGQAALRNRNVSSTGNTLGIDIGANAVNSAGQGQQIPTVYDSKGRPIQLGFNVDTNNSGGAYAGASGQGTIAINYTKRGGASMRFTGFILTSQVSDITAYDLGRIKH